MRYKIKKRYRLPGYDYSAQGYYFVTICTKDRERFFGQVVQERMILSAIGEIAERFWLEIPARFPNIQLDAWVIMPNHIHGILVIEAQGNQGGNGGIKDNRCNKKNDDDKGGRGWGRGRGRCGNAPWRVPTSKLVPTFIDTPIDIPTSTFVPTSIDIPSSKLVSTSRLADTPRPSYKSCNSPILSGMHPLVKNSISSVINHYKGNVKRFCNQNHMAYFAWQSRFHDRIIRDERALQTIRRYIKENPLRWSGDRLRRER